MVLTVNHKTNLIFQGLIQEMLTLIHKNILFTQVKVFRSLVNIFCVLSCGLAVRAGRLTRDI